MFERFSGAVIPVDTQIFNLVNGLPHFFVVDVFMLGITAITTLGVFWILLSLYLRITKKYRNLFSLILIFSLTACILVEILLKFLFGRMRPSLELTSAIVVGPHVAEFFNSYSFPSGHAYMAFGSIPLFTYFNKKLFWPLFVFGSLVSFSRIYLGKHYPFDVIVGALLGIIVAKILLWLFIISQKRLHKR